MCSYIQYMHTYTYTHAYAYCVYTHKAMTESIQTVKTCDKTFLQINKKLKQIIKKIKYSDH